MSLRFFCFKIDFKRYFSSAIPNNRDGGDVPDICVKRTFSVWVWALVVVNNDTLSQGVTVPKVSLLQWSVKFCRSFTNSRSRPIRYLASSEPQIPLYPSFIVFQRLQIVRASTVCSAGSFQIDSVILLNIFISCAGAPSKKTKVEFQICRSNAHMLFFCRLHSRAVRFGVEAGFSLAYFPLPSGLPLWSDRSPIRVSSSLSRHVQS